MSNADKAPVKKKKKQGFAAHPENINRKGQPKRGTSITSILRKKLGDTVLIEDGPLKGKIITKNEYIALKLIDIACNDQDERQFHAIKYIFDRVDGIPAKMVQKLSRDIFVIPPKEREQKKLIAKC